MLEDDYLINRPKMTAIGFFPRSHSRCPSDAFRIVDRVSSWRKTTMNPRRLKKLRKKKPSKLGDEEYFRRRCSYAPQFPFRALFATSGAPEQLFAVTRSNLVTTPVMIHQKQYAGNLLHIYGENGSNVRNLKIVLRDRRNTIVYLRSKADDSEPTERFLDIDEI